MAEQTLTTPIDSVVDSAPIVEPPITGEAFAVMVELGRSELIEGSIIQMSPPQGRHGRCESKFTYLLMQFALERRSGIVMSGEAGVYTQRNPDSVRGMDVAYLANERWAQQKNKDGYLEVPPDLIVEVLSPDDRWSNVTQKLREYFAIGVRLVWVADPEAGVVFAYRSLTDMREFKTEDTLTAAEVLPGFSAPVAALFED